MVELTIFVTLSKSTGSLIKILIINEFIVSGGCITLVIHF